jgi:GT2 family glycosyltransferase
MSGLADIAVIIVSWNTRDYLRSCLASLREPPPGRSLEVIVVDNASADGSPDMVAAEFPEVKLIRAPGNLGFARANNLGIRASASRYVCLVNSDVKLLDDCLGRLAGFMDRNPGAGMCGPRVLNADLTLQSSCRRLPGLWNNACYALGLPRLFPRSEFFGGEHMLFFNHDETRAVEALVGCFILVRRQAMEEVGLLDEGFFIYAEDVDWCKRFHDAGWEVVFYPEARAIHYRGGSSAADPRRFALEQQRAVMRFWRKHHGSLRTWLAAMLHAWLLTARLLAAGLRLPAAGKSRAAVRESMRRNLACLVALPGDLAAGQAVNRTGGEPRWFAD